MDGETLRNVVVERVLDAFIECVRSGESPTVEQLMEEFPECEQQLRELLPVLLRMETASPAKHEKSRIKPERDAIQDSVEFDDFIAPDE